MSLMFMSKVFRKFRASSPCEKRTNSACRDAESTLSLKVSLKVLNMAAKEAFSSVDSSHSQVSTVLGERASCGDDHDEILLMASQPAVHPDLGLHIDDESPFMHLNTNTALSKHDTAEYDTDDHHLMAEVTAHVLEHTVLVNDQSETTNLHALEMFESKTPIPIRISEYIARIRKYSGCSASAITLAVIYLERVKTLEANLELTKHNFQRLFTVAVIVACKFLEDDPCPNRRWAEIAELPVVEVNFLEARFLFFIAFNLQVTRDEYESFLQPIRTLAAGQTTVTREASLPQDRETVVEKL